MSEPFDPKICEEMTGYTFDEIISMYKDYDRMAKENEEIRNIGEYNRGWSDGRKDTMRAYGIQDERVEL